MKVTAEVFFVAVALTVVALVWIAFDFCWSLLEDRVIHPWLCRRMQAKYGMTERDAWLAIYRAQRTPVTFWVRGWWNWKRHGGGT